MKISTLVISVWAVGTFVEIFEAGAGGINLRSFVRRSTVMTGAAAPVKLSFVDSFSVGYSEVRCFSLFEGSFESILSALSGKSQVLVCSFSLHSHVRCYQICRVCPD